MSCWKKTTTEKYNPLKCRPNDRALIIAIQYIHEPIENRILKAKENSDAINWLLKTRFKVLNTNIKFLADWIQHNDDYLPTYRNITNELFKLLLHAKKYPDARIYLFYFGKGMAFEKSGEIQEIIVPCDYLRNKEYITKTELSRIFIYQLMPGQFTLLFFDSCHRGGIVEMPYVYLNGKETKINKPLPRLANVVCMNCNSDNLPPGTPRSSMYMKAMNGFWHGELTEKFIEACRKYKPEGNVYKIFKYIDRQFKKRKWHGYIYMGSTISFEDRTIYM